MSIVRRNDMYWPRGDGCGRLKGPEATHEDAKTAMRIAHWNIKNEGGRWKNFCENCQSAGRK